MRASSQGATDFHARADTMRSILPIAGTLLLVCVLSPRLDGRLLAADNTPNEGVQFYKDKIRPILIQNCYKCHSDDPLGHLRVDSRAAILQGGKRGPAIVPGEPEKSVLIDAVRQTGDLKMPKEASKLEDQQIADLVAWIKMGAPWDPDEASRPLAISVSSAAAASSVGEEFFENKVRPIFANVCSECHGDKATSGLQVFSREMLLLGGKRGPAIVPNDPEKSLMIQAVRQSGDLKMPKGGKLTPEEVQNLTEWVRMGAPWPKARPLLASGAGSFKILPEERSFWSFQPIKMPAIPPVKDVHWPKTNIDRLVLAKLEAKAIAPAPPADRRTLIRRATFDLTGLPPTPEEIDAFQKDKSPNAFAKVVDKLLASPRYGERWGRHWLDVARYAEDDVRGLDPKGRGYMPFRGAYVYRDWVIKAINDDLPYDKFVRWQLAGDLSAEKNIRDALPGTAFLGGGPWLWDQAEPVQGRADERNERIDAVSRGLLGLTVACARCHNHKYDPISQKDYYALAGVFASTTYTEYPRVSEVQVKAWRQKQQAIDDLEEELGEFTRQEGKQYTEILAHQTAKYMMAAWRVSGKPKATVDEAAEEAKLEPEILARWVKFLVKPHAHYSFLNDWSAMIASGGTEAQAKLLSDNFEALVLRIMADAKKI